MAAITCNVCGRGDLMTEQALVQHMRDKEDSQHKTGQPYPDVCTCGESFETTMEMTSHRLSCLKLSTQGQHSDKDVVDLTSRPDMAPEAKRHLENRLLEFYENHVKIDPKEMKQAKQVATTVSEHLLKHLQQRFEFQKMKFDKIQPAGSAFDGLKVGAPDEFDMIIPIVLEGYRWEAIDGRRATVGGEDLNAPGFWLIKKMYPFTSEMDPYVKKVNGDEYISPGFLIRDLQRKVHKIIKKFKLPNGVTKLRAGLKGPSMYVQVEYTPAGSVVKKKFDLDFVLEVRVGTKPLVAKRHPTVTQQGSLGDNPMALLWKESCATRESKKMQSLPETGCLKKCWKLVKAIAARDKHLSSLSSYFFKSLFLNFLERKPYGSGWHEGQLVDRFLDVFIYMEEVLHQQWLPVYVLRDVNMLFPRFDLMQVENAYYYVRKINATQSHVQLLCTRLSQAETKRDKKYTVESRDRPRQRPASGVGQARKGGQRRRKQRGKTGSNVRQRTSQNSSTRNAGQATEQNRRRGGGTQATRRQTTLEMQWRRIGELNKMTQRHLYWSDDEADDYESHDYD